MAHIFGETEVYYYGRSKRTPRKNWLVNKRIGVIRLSVKKINEFNDLDEIRYKLIIPLGCQL